MVFEKSSNVKSASIGHTCVQGYDPINLAITNIMELKEKMKQRIRTCLKTEEVSVRSVAADE